MVSNAARQITIRRIRENDLVELTSALSPSISNEQVRLRWQEHQDGHREMLVAEVDGRAAGTVSIGGHRYERPGSLRMFALDVGSAFRRQGIGSAFIKAAEQDARDRGLRKVNLEVAVEDLNAARLYERLGYQRLDEQIKDRWWKLADDGFSQQVEELSWVMVKTL